MFDFGGQLVFRANWSYFFKAYFLPLTSALVLSVTSIINSEDSAIISFKMARSTVAPRLSILERKTYFLPWLIRSESTPEL